jgi:dTMP kinase
MGHFITFEGIEGSGKSTQIAMLRAALQQLGHAVVQTREPGGCAIADQIRSILLHPQNSALEATAELLLYAAARAQHVNEIIRPALASGQLVLCDRYTDATLAYQGDGRGLDRELIIELNRVASQAATPDLTILIDLQVETGLARALSREVALQDSSEGRFEREALDFHQRVRDGYLALSKAEPARFAVVDGSLPIEELAAEIQQEVLRFLEQKRTNQ